MLLYAVTPVLLGSGLILAIAGMNGSLGAAALFAGIAAGFVGFFAAR